MSRRLVLRVVLPVAGALVLVVVVLGVTAWLGKRHANDALLSFTRHLGEVRASISTVDADAARKSLDAARGDLDRARAARSSFGLRLASHLPLGGGDATAGLDAFVAGGEELYTAAARATHVLEAL